MALPVTRHRFTVEDYEQMGAAGVLTEDDRVELIAGEIVDMSPIRPRHAACVNQATWLLSGQLGDAGRLSVQNPVRLGDHDEPQPDLMVLRPGPDYDRSLPTPADVLLLIEVADTSLSYDRRVKIPLYARAGIAEVWLVDLKGRLVFRYSDPHEGAYRRTERVGRGQRLTALNLPGLEIAVDDLFA
jgi:Uma2 family endonuclease